MKLTVEITRSPKTRNLSAKVVQKSGGETHRGSNLLAGRRIREIETAKRAVMEWCADEAPAAILHFRIEASAAAEPGKHPARKAPGRATSSGDER